VAPGTAGSELGKSELGNSEWASMREMQSHSMLPWGVHRRSAADRCIETFCAGAKDMELQPEGVRPRGDPGRGILDGSEIFGFRPIFR